jgi:hypothetical protein
MFESGFFASFLVDQQQQQCETGTGRQEMRRTEADTDDNIVFPIFSQKKKTAQLRNRQNQKS